MEVLVSLVIVALIAGFAIPNIERTLGLYHLETSAAMIAGKLSDARINAIKRNRQVWVEITFSDNQARVQTTDPAAPWNNIDVGDPLFLTNRVVFGGSGGSGGSSGSGDSWRLTFDSVGRPTAPSTITLTTISTTS